MRFHKKFLVHFNLTNPIIFLILNTFISCANSISNWLHQNAWRFFYMNHTRCWDFLPWYCFLNMINNHFLQTVQGHAHTNFSKQIIRNLDSTHGCHSDQLCQLPTLHLHILLPRQLLFQLERSLCSFLNHRTVHILNVVSLETFPLTHLTCFSHYFFVST